MTEPEVIDLPEELPDLSIHKTAGWRVDIRTDGSHTQEILSKANDAGTMDVCKSIINFDQANISHNII